MTPDLNYDIQGVEAVPYAATPQVAFKLRVSDASADEAADDVNEDPSPATQFHSIALHCQIRIEPHQRRYSEQSEQRLADLFGPKARWSKTLKSMLWTHADVVIGPFTGSKTVDLLVPCCFDFNVAATKYFDALEDGEIPLTLLFSGTIFYQAEDDRLQVTQIGWDKEATFRLPVAVWRKMMDMYYPNIAWLYLRKDVFDRLHAFKQNQSIPTWEQALERLLEQAGSGDRGKTMKQTSGTPTA